MWPTGLLFIKTSPVKQYSYENDFSGALDALHQSFLVCNTVPIVIDDLPYWSPMGVVRTQPFVKSFAGNI